MGLSNINQRGFSPNKGFGWLNLTRQYVRSLVSQGVSTDYGTSLVYDTFFRALSPRGNISATLPPRNLAAWYDVNDTSSMLNASAAVPTNGQAVKLIADKSGNSNVNVLCLNGTTTNYASAPDSSALSITGDIDVRFYGALDTWLPAATQALIVKDGGQPNRSYGLYIDTAGKPWFIWSTDGANAGILSALSTAATGFSAFSLNWVRVTLDVDNGAAGRTATFYTSSDGATWTQLGTPVTVGVTTSIFDSTANLRLGMGQAAADIFSGRIHRAQIRNNILDNGTGIQFDANFALAAKLATSFTESSGNVATVTINTSGDLGARISGPRDLYQGTVANQPILTIATRANQLTFDGTNDYMRAAAFALAQPETVYFVGSQITWTNVDSFYDGNGASNAMGMAQTATTPKIGLYAGTLQSDLVTTLALNIQGVLTAVFSGAASFLRLNRTAAASASPNTQSANGFTLAADRGAVANAFGNITASEIAIYSEASTSTTMSQIINYLASKWGVSL